MAYEPKPGEGSLFKNKNRRDEKDPAYRGYFITPDGGVMGFRMWQNKSNNGGDPILSLKPDDREAEYWAKKFGRTAVTANGQAADSRGRTVKPSAQQSRHAVAEDDPFEDDLPF